MTYSFSHDERFDYQSFSSQNSDFNEGKFRSYVMLACLGICVIIIIIALL